MTTSIPTQAQVVVIGGGIVGCSTAYHLTKVGFKDVVLLERKEIASGTTWAAAGLLAQLRQNQEMTNLAKYALECYGKLEEETGVATGFKMNGAIGVCQTEDRRREWLRGAAMAGNFGVEMYEISMQEAEKMVPGMATDDLVAAFYLPNDGITDPVGTAQALAKGAKLGGAQIIEGIKVTDIKVENGVIKGVSTDQGDIAAEYVVNCAGMWSRALGQKIGVSLPLLAAEHMHAITLPIEGLKKSFPTVRDFDGYSYFKEESGGILLGGFEPVSKPWGMDGIPEDFKFSELSEDWDQFELFLECGFKRFPVLETAQIRHLSVVPESFTPDNAFMIGEAPGVKNFFVGCGMNSVGIAGAAGVGRALSQWVAQGHPEEQLWPVDVRRWFPWQQNINYLEKRITESVGILYEHHYPNRQRTTARPVIMSPIHDRLKENGAAFSMIAGWERADWFAPEGVEPVHQYDWHTPNWFEHQGAEHMAVRDGVGMYDLSSMGKYIVQGRDAGKVLQQLCSNNIDVPVGSVVYTPILNEKGGFESDLTVTRIADDEYFLVTAAGTTVRDHDFIKRRIPEDAICTITDVTHGYSMLAVMGPKSRDLLAALTKEDLSNVGFPYATGKFMDLALARPLAIRMSYVGELGWELYIPTMFTQAVFDAIMEAGKAFDLKLVGMQAVNSLRLETGLRHWETDITPEDTPYEAGLGFGVKLDKGPFTGRDALEAQKAAGPLTKRMAMFVLEDTEPRLYANEPVYRDGEVVGQITSGGYGYKIGAPVGMGYVNNADGVNAEWLSSGKFEIMVEGKRIPAKASLRSPYDPKNERTKM